MQYTRPALIQFSYLSPFIDTAGRSANSYFVVEDCGGIGTFHGAVHACAKSRGRSVCGISVSESNTLLHKWLHSLFSVVDSAAQHRTWLDYGLPEYFVDFYGAGFPCQPFARCGNKLGTRDIRFSFVVAQLDAILGRMKPKCALLENTEDFQSTFDKLLKPVARRHGYLIVTTVLNSDQWVPQNRVRFYALLIASRFVPPGFDLDSLIPRVPVVCPAQDFWAWIRSVSQRLRWITIADAKAKHRTSQVFIRNLDHVLTTGTEKVKQSQRRPAYIFCDMFASPTRVHCALNQIPCVTRTRGAACRLFVFCAPSGPVLTRCARLDCAALGSLQGWSPASVQTMMSSVSSRQLCGAFGNGMTLPVVMEFVSALMSLLATKGR